MSAAEHCEYLVETCTYVRVRIAEGCDAITRVTGDGGDEWRARFWNFHTDQDVLEHLVFNAVANGVRDAGQLDGWADLPEGSVTMSVEEVGVWP